MPTDRQRFVLVRLYVEHGWSAPHLSRVLGLGRRAIENALKLEGVTMIRRSVKLRDPFMTPLMAKGWFEAAGRADRSGIEDPAPQSQRREDGTLVFRNRRCQTCGLLTRYQTHCPNGHPLDYGRRSDPVQTLREEEEHR